MSPAASSPAARASSLIGRLIARARRMPRNAAAGNAGMLNRKMKKQSARQ